MQGTFVFLLGVCEPVLIYTRALHPQKACAWVGIAKYNFHVLTLQYGIRLEMLSIGEMWKVSWQLQEILSSAETHIAISSSL